VSLLITFLDPSPHNNEQCVWESFSSFVTRTLYVTLILQNPFAKLPQLTATFKVGVLTKHKKKKIKCNCLCEVSIKFITKAIHLTAVQHTED
jgi:hypothetical protein